MHVLLKQGLEDQLLALVVNKERPDLEETKTQLIIQSTEFTIKLKQLEDELLYKLSTAEGDITGTKQQHDTGQTGGNIIPWERMLLRHACSRVGIPVANLLTMSYVAGCLCRGCAAD